MADLHDDDPAFGFEDLVEDTVAAMANAVGDLAAGELLGARRAGLVSQGADALDELPAERLRLDTPSSRAAERRISRL